MKLCQTPDCTLPDFHSCCHSFELQVGKRIQPALSRVCPTSVPAEDASIEKGVVHAPKTVARAGNRFQLDIDFVRKCMGEQVGLVIRLPEELRGSPQTGFFDATVVEHVTYGKFVVVVADDKGGTLKLQSKDLVRDDVVANWRQISNEMHSAQQSAICSKQHDAAARRIHLFVNTLKENFTIASTQKVFSLDGDGSNREAYKHAFAGMPAEKVPEFHTFEIDADVALSQVMVYGGQTVTYTGAQARNKFGYGCDGKDMNAPPGIEYLITNRVNTSKVSNTIVTKEDCDSVVGLNLDYCGSFSKGWDFEAAQRQFVNLLARLPRLVVLCVTIGKRGRKALKNDFERYARTPYGFHVVKTFSGASDNSKVVSRVYLRLFDIPRTLKIPGSMWSWTGSKSESVVQRSAWYNCVVKFVEPRTGKTVVYCVDDGFDDEYLTLTPDNLRDWAIPDYLGDTLPAQEEEESSRLRAALDAIDADYNRSVALIRALMEKSSKAAPKSAIHKRTYLCSRCGVPKKGHVCGKSKTTTMAASCAFRTTRA